MSDLSVQKNIELVVGRFIDEVMNGRNLKVLDEIAPIDYVDHNTAPLPLPGREGWKKRLEKLHASFPDLHMTVDETIATGDKVIVRYTIRATSKVLPNESEQTGKTIEVSGINISRIADNKIAENWNQFDELLMMKQLGLIPS